MQVTLLMSLRSGVATLVRLKYIIDISNIENTATPEAAEKLLATLV